LVSFRSGTTPVKGFRNSGIETSLES
jgi:hypothetical protein